MPELCFTDNFSILPKQYTAECVRTYCIPTFSVVLTPSKNYEIKGLT